MKGIKNYKKLIGRKYYHHILNRYYAWRFNKVKHQPENRLIYINPKDVNYYLLSNEFTRDFRNFNKLKVPKHNLEKGIFSPYAFKDLVLPGDWDLHKKPYRFDNVYAGLSQYFDESRDNEKIEYIQTYLIREEIREQEEYAKKRIEKNKDLYKSMAENGYISQYSLGKKDHTDNPYTRPSEICVNIGRDGELIFNNSDAHHRLAIAKILSIDRVPATVIVRHKKWEEIRQKIADTPDENKNGIETNQYLKHPDIRYLLE